MWFVDSPFFAHKLMAGSVPVRRGAASIPRTAETALLDRYRLASMTPNIAVSRPLASACITRFEF